MIRPSELLTAYKGFPASLWHDRGRVALAWLMVVLVVGTNTAMIWLIGKPFNLLQQGLYDELPRTLLVFALVVLANQAGQVVGGMLANRVGFYTLGRIRNGLLGSYLRLSFPVLDRYARGDLLARLSNDATAVKQTLVQVYIYSLSHILTLGIYIFMLFWIDLQLALWALALTPLFLLHQRIFAPLKRRTAEQFYHYNGRLLGLEEQLLANSRGISNNTAEAGAAATHDRAFSLARDWVIREQNTDVWFTASFSLLIYFVGLVVVLQGADGIREERFGLGHLVSFLLYLGYLTVPARGLADIVFQAVGASAAARRIRDMLSLSPLVTEREGARALQAGDGDIRVEGLHFFHAPDRPLFSGVDLHIRGGETVAIVGPSGSGKSTFAALLARHYDPQQGRILLNGQDLRDVTLDSLRRAITTVSQQPFLLADTIRANLLMVRPDADEAQLRTACRQAYAEDFIDDLPAGLDTVIGAGGVQLSAGQQQRLSLAQAFLRDTPVMILDEATSALDSHSEQRVTEAMDHLRQGRTTLLIAHRYSSLQAAQRVVYFNGDGTVTVGGHEQLLAQHEGYRQAVQWQTGQK